MMTVKRPLWCQDSTCTPDVNHDMSATHGEGATGWCCGRTADTMLTVRQGVEHVNDGHFCIKSPRGIVMLEIQEADLEIMGRLAFRGLVARDPDRHFNGFWFTGRKAGFAKQQNSGWGAGMTQRQQPLLVRGPMTGKVYVILRYKRNALGDIQAIEKADVTEDFNRLLSDILAEVLPEEEPDQVGEPG